MRKEQNTKLGWSVLSKTLSKFCKLFDKKRQTAATGFIWNKHTLSSTQSVINI